MILVDTSVWIRALGNHMPYKPELDRLLATDQVAGHELVYGELLIGDRGGRRKFLDSYQRIEYAISVPHEEVVQFVLKRNLHGRGAGWVDVQLLASAIVDHFPLWTADRDVATLAIELGVGYNVAI